RIAGAPELLGGLLRAQLSAVPDNLWPRAVRCSLRGDAFDGRTSRRRQRAARIDLRADGFSVMGKVQEHRSTLNSQVSSLNFQVSSLNGSAPRLRRALTLERCELLGSSIVDDRIRST